ncbi:MAG TPA: hypothetical protein VI953_01785 [Candidatus Paceibacterota bacterium]
MDTTYSQSNPNPNSQFKARVMRRIYIVTYLRRALSPFAIKCYLALGLFWQIGQYVWVDRVVQNAPGFAHPLATASFFANAFSQTEALVQVLSLGVLACVLWLVADLMYKGRHVLTPAF